jgi:two-component system, response regulator PdtaR
VTIPLAQPLRGLPVAIMHPGPSGSRGRVEPQKLRAMIVEDEFIIALELETVLTDLGVDVVASAGSVEMAVRLAGEVRPDFVTMDIKLPGDRDGISGATEIFERFGIRSIFVSAYKDEEMLARAQAAQPLGWVRKPVATAALKAVLPRTPGGAN